MKAVWLVATLGLAACATGGDLQRVTSTDCKIYPLEATRSSATARAQASELDRKYAVAALGTSDLRQSLLSRPTGHVGIIEEALRKCY